MSLEFDQLMDADGIKGVKPQSNDLAVIGYLLGIHPGHPCNETWPKRVTSWGCHFRRRRVFCFRSCEVSTDKGMKTSISREYEDIARL